MGLLLQVEWAESDDPMRMTWRLDSKHLGGRLSMSLPSDLGTGEFVSDTICRQVLRTPLQMQRSCRQLAVRRAYRASAGVRLFRSKP